MNTAYSVQQALAEIKEDIGFKVLIKAILVISGHNAFLVDSAEHPENQKWIVIHYPGLESLLDAKIGGWMGGIYSYLDPVTIQGLAEKGTTRRAGLVLSNIDKLEIYRDGEKFIIL